jgi:putative transposase
MTKEAKENVRVLLSQDKDWLRQQVQGLVQEVLEQEMNETLGAGRYERGDGRRGYRSGHYRRSLITRVGKLELRVPQDRDGQFSTEVFERFSRSEKALTTSLMEMYVHGVSTRKVKHITEELCGHEFDKSSISRLNKTLDDSLKQFAERQLDEEYPYLMLDARYERVREDGVVRRKAVLVAIGINWEGRRCVLGVELARKESTSTWSDFLRSLLARGLRGVEVVVSDSHEGLRNSVTALLSSSVWQRCYVHFLRNARDHLPRKGDDDVITELKWLYERKDVAEARTDLAAWLKKWSSKYPKLCDWVEENIEETLSFYRLPEHHRKHLRSTNLLERLNEELKRRTWLVRVFPNEDSCLRLVRALGAEAHEEWQDGARYLNMQLLREHRRASVRAAA